jgi:hypothetical protein
VARAASRAASPPCRAAPMSAACRRYHRDVSAAAARMTAAVLLPRSRPGPLATRHWHRRALVGTGTVARSSSADERRAKVRRRCRVSGEPGDAPGHGAGRGTRVRPVARANAAMASLQVVRFSSGSHE